MENTEIPPPLNFQNNTTKKKYEKKEIKKENKLVLKDREQHDISIRVDWNKITNFLASEKGSSGVFFLETEEKKIICIKSGSTIAEEIFCSVFAQKLNVRCPKVN
jgi:ribosomal protein L25 (general stress protein Ctc)